MKTLLKLLFIVACVGLITSCEKEEGLFKNDVELKSAQPISVTVPFEVNLQGEIVSFDPEATDCTDDGYLGRVVVDACGTANQMGKASLVFNFCTAGPADPNIEGSKMTYAGFFADLVAANSDVLHLFYAAGSVINGRTDEHPEHVYEYWSSPITILGGTGRYEGATGNLTSDDYCSTLDDYTYHRFYGEITLVKGKRK